MYYSNHITRSLGIVVLTLASVVTGCGKNQSVDLAFSNYTVAKVQPGGPAQIMFAQKVEPRKIEAPSIFLMRLDHWMDGLFPKAHAAISQIKMCFKRLRFKQDGETTSGDSATDADNVDLTLGLVTLSTAGTTLSSVDVPKATYKRIEFDLEDGCGTGYSLYVDNSGIYQTTDRITMKFAGTFDAATSGGALGMSIQGIITALSTVTNGTQLKNTAEAASGSF